MNAKNSIWFLLVTISLALLLPAAWSDIYRYTDDRGVAHYTDQKANVPEQYIDTVTTIKEAPATPDNQADVPEPEFSEPAPQAPVPAKQPPPQASRSAQLEAKQEQLQALRDEQIRVAAEKEAQLLRYKIRKRKSVTRARLRDLNEKEQILTQKIQALEAEIKSLGGTP